MPLPIPDLPDTNLFKSPSSISAPKINNELITTNSPKDFVTDGKDNLNIPKRLDISTAPSSPMNSSISLERRVNSADIFRTRQNNDNKCSLLNNKKHPDWLKSLLSRFQQVFLKRTDQKFFSGCEKTSKNASASENDLSIISKSTIDTTVRVVNSIVDNDKNLKTTKLDDNNDDDYDDNSDVDNLLQQEICDAIIPKSLNCNSVQKDSLEKSSIFEVCAQIPRHFAKEPEVLGKVGRFTIVRESEDFNTTLFDQCHCQEKPCRFSANGGSHPVLPPETLPDLLPYSSQFYDTTPIGIPIHRGSMGLTSYKPTSQRFDAQFKYNSWESHRQGYSRSPSLYTQQSSAATSKSSLSSLKFYSDSTNLNVNNRTSSSSDLTQTRSRSKNIVNKPVKTSSSSSAVNCLIRRKRSSIKMSDNLFQQQQQEPLHDRRQQSSITTVPSKSDTNESHTTINSINSHSGRKFEVEWSSSESASTSSPSSTMSSILSVASSLNSSLYSLQGTSTRSSTLSSKCGRKFEVTVVSSGNSG